MHEEGEADWLCRYHKEFNTSASISAKDSPHGAQRSAGLRRESRDLLPQVDIAPCHNRRSNQIKGPGPGAVARGRN